MWSTFQPIVFTTMFLLRLPYLPRQLTTPEITYPATVPINFSLNVQYSTITQRLIIFLLPKHIIWRPRILTPGAPSITLKISLNHTNSMLPAHRSGVSILRFLGADNSLAMIGSQHCYMERIWNWKDDLKTQIMNKMQCFLQPCMRTYQPGSAAL